MNKLSIALAFLLALIMLASSLSSTSFWDGLSGLTSQSGLITSCGANFTEDQGYAKLVEWIGLSLVAIMVGLMWAIIGQILGGAFGSPKYNEFIKGMIWGSVETAALLGLLSSLFLVLYPYGNAQLDTARAYSVIAKNTVMFDFSLMLGVNMIAGFATNMNPQFKLPGKVFRTLGFQLAPMFKPLIDILGVTMQLITTAVVMWSAQEFLLCFVKGVMLVLLLPMGFFLRGFGLKAGGNALIAIALSLYFIYPAMIVMLGQAVTSQVKDELTTTGVPHFWDTCLDKPICCASGVPAPANDHDPYILNGDPNEKMSVAEINNGVFNLMSDPNGGNNGPNFCIYNTVLANAYRSTFGMVEGTGLLGVAGGAAVLGIFKYMNLSWMTAGLMVPLWAFAIYAIMEMVYFVFILTMLVPIFIIFVTLTLAKEIAKVLGTEIDLSSLEKLI